MYKTMIVKNFKMICKVHDTFNKSDDFEKKHSLRIRKSGLTTNIINPCSEN